MTSAYKERIFSQLKERNFRENHNGCSKVLIDSFNVVYDRACALTVDNNRLQSELTKLKQERTDSQSLGPVTLAPKSYNMEQKVFQLQEEVTNLYREKSLLGTQVLELTKTVQEKDHLLQVKNYRIVDLDSALSEAHAQLHSCQEEAQKMMLAIQTMRDEINANGIVIHSLEQKNRELLESNELLVKYRRGQDDTVERRSVEHDVEFWRRQQFIQHDIAEASKCSHDDHLTHVRQFPDYLSPDRSNKSSLHSSFTTATAATLPSKIIKRFDAHDSEVVCVRWAPSGRLFASGGADRRLKLWTYIDGNIESKNIISGCNQGITSIDFDSEGTLVLAGSNDWTCRVWSCHEGRLRQTFTGHTNKVLCAKFMGDYSRVVTGSGDRTLRLWDVKSGHQSCYKTLLTQSTCHDVVYSVLLNLVVSGHYDKKLRLWDTRKDINTDQIPLPGRITGLDILQDTFLVLAATKDDSLHVWDLRMNKMVHCLKTEGVKVGHEHCRPSFSPDGQFACLGNSDGSLFLWNVHSGALVANIRGDSHAIVAVHWNPNGSSLLSCDKQKCISLWASD